MRLKVLVAVEANSVCADRPAERGMEGVRDGDGGLGEAGRGKGNKEGEEKRPARSTHSAARHRLALTLSIGAQHTATYCQTEELTATETTNGLTEQNRDRRKTTTEAHTEIGTVSQKERERDRQTDINQRVLPR